MLYINFKSKLILKYYSSSINYIIIIKLEAWNLKLKIKIIILLLTCSLSNSFAQNLKSPDEFNIEKKQIHQEQNEISFLSFPILISFKTYQIILSPIKGENCPMYPSCSYYGIEAIKKYNIKGLLMTSDRINRCGHDLKYYNTIIFNDQIKYLDSIRVDNK